MANGAIVFWTASLRPDLCCGFASTVTFVGPRPRPLLVPVNRAQRDTSPLYSRSLQKVQSDGLHRTALRHRVPLAPEVGCRSIPSTVCPKVRINRLFCLMVLLLVRCILASLFVATSYTVRRRRQESTLCFLQSVYSETDTWWSVSQQSQSQLLACRTHPLVTPTEAPRNLSITGSIIEVERLCQCLLNGSTLLMVPSCPMPCVHCYATR